MGRKATSPKSFWAKVDKSAGPDECWLWLGQKDRQGYPKVSIRDEMVRGARYAFFLGYDRWPVGAVLHSCDNPPCVNPLHLREGTNRENHFDRVQRERFMIPRRQVTAMREMLRGGISVRFVANLYNISEAYVGRIRDRKARAYCD